MPSVRKAAVFAFFLCCVVLVFSQNGEWKEYVYAEDGFAISSPREPAVQKSTVPVKMGEVEVHLYNIPLEKYQVVILYSPFHPNDKRTAEQALNDGKQPLLQSGAKLISEKPVSLGKYPGLEVEAENARYRQHGRFYVVERKMYAIIASTSQGKAFPAEELQRWFDSFRLVEPKK